MNLQSGDGVWTTGCQLSNAETYDVSMRGFAHLRIETPCPRLEITSQYRGTGSDTLPEGADLHEVLGGRSDNWSWQILGTSAVESAWTKQSTRSPPEYNGRVYGPVVSWPKMFETLRSVYAYVLDEAPPTSVFSLYFFPSDLSINRAEFRATSNPLSLPLYLPFDVSSPTAQGKEAEKPQLNSMQSAYVQALQVACFEYMHALFFTKRLKAMNYLTHSVADYVTCTAAALVTFASDPNFAATFPAANSTDIDSAREVAKDRNDPDYLAMALGAKNIAHLLGGDTKSVRVSAGDTAAISKIIQLARAMLQDPVDLSYRLYPLKQVALQPPYVVTPLAGTSGG